MAYCFFLGEVMLPVTPAKLQLSIQNQNTTLSLIDEGQINILKSPGLTDVSFEMVIPQVKHNYAVYPNGFRPVEYYTGMLKKLKTEKKPFWFKVTRMSPAGKTLFDMNMRVSLEEYKLTEDAKQGLDVIADIKLKEYREIVTRVGTVTIDSQTNEVAAEVEVQRETDNAPVKESHTVVSGDTLWAIAKRYLGDGNRYREIASLNNIPNPDVIYPGQVLLMP